MSPELHADELVRSNVQDVMVGYTGGWASDTRPLRSRLLEVLLSNLLSALVAAALALMFVAVALLLAH